MQCCCGAVCSFEAVNGIPQCNVSKFVPKSVIEVVNGLTGGSREWNAGAAGTGAWQFPFWLSYSTSSSAHQIAAFMRLGHDGVRCIVLQYKSDGGRATAGERTSE